MSRNNSSKRGRPDIDPLERTTSQPRTAAHALRRDLFRCPGTSENVGLAELAHMERSGNTLLVESAVDGLEASPMYQRLADENYRTQDATESRFVSSNYPHVLMHARLFAAGRLAERMDRQRRKEQRKRT